MSFLVIIIYQLLVNNIFSNYNNLNSANIAILKFRTYNPFLNNLNKDFNSKDFKSFIFSNLYFELENIESSQTLNVFIDTKTNLLKFNQIKNNKLCNYNISIDNNNEYKKINSNSLSCQILQKIKIYSNLNMTEYTYKQFIFDNYKCLNNSLCGTAGIDIYSDYNKEMAFIPQMHSILNISEQSWAFFYLTNEEGIFIFGDMSHNYLKNIYNEKNLISFYTKSNCFEILIDSIILEYNNNSIINSGDNNDNINVEISPEIEGIEFGNFYFNYIYDYFNYYIDKNICRIEIIDLTITIIYCDGNKFGKKDIDKFPNLIFCKYKLNFNISIKNEDLFYYKDSKYFLKIYKRFGVEKKFILGRLFLQKYLAIFNADKKQIFFYNNNSKIDDNDNSKNINTYSNKLFIIITFVTSIITFLIIGILIGKNMLKKRKNMANELDDDDYLYEEN